MHIEAGPRVVAVLEELSVERLNPSPPWRRSTRRRWCRLPDELVEEQPAKVQTIMRANRAPLTSQAARRPGRRGSCTAGTYSAVNAQQRRSGRGRSATRIGRHRRAVDRPAVQLLGPARSVDTVPTSALAPSITAGHRRRPGRARRTRGWIDTPGGTAIIGWIEDHWLTLPSRCCRRPHRRRRSAAPSQRRDAGGTTQATPRHRAARRRRARSSTRRRTPQPPSQGTRGPVREHVGPWRRRRAYRSRSALGDVGYPTVGERAVHRHRRMCCTTPPLTYQTPPARCARVRGGAACEHVRGRWPAPPDREVCIVGGSWSAGGP